MEKQVNIPALRFPEFEGEFVYRKLEDVCIIIMGQSPNSKSYNENGEGYYLIQGNADIKNRVSCPRQWTSMPTKICEIGDIILTVRAPVGAVSKSNHNACIGRGVCVIRNLGNYDLEYIYQFLLDFETKWGKLEQGSTFTAISGGDIKSIKSAFPTLPEQQKIASFLSAVDEKTQQISRKKELLEQYKKGVMQQLFSGKLRFKDENGKDYPKWEDRKFGDVLNLQIREILKPNYNYLAIGIRSHVKGTFQKPDSDPSKIAMDKLFVVKENDLIVNITFAWEGAIAIAKKEDEGGLVSHRFPTYTFNSRYLLREYFAQVIIDKRLRMILDLISPGGAGRNRVLSKKDFLKIDWSFPCIDEQEKIANFLSSIDTKIESINQQINQMQCFKKGLLQNMFVAA